MTYRYVLQDVNILSYEKSPVHLFLILAFGIGGLRNSKEPYLSDFARPPKSRHVREKERLGRPWGFTHWSNEERKNGKEEKE